MRGALAAALRAPWLKDPLWTRARMVPSLDLRFEDALLRDSVSGQRLVTFTRASTGTYVGSDGLVKTAAVDEARITHDPTTGRRLGLLLEEARTNLLLRSEEFDNASWTKQNITVTANTVTAPDGALTADTITDTLDGSAVVHSLSQTTSGYGSGAAVTASVFAKAGTMPRIQILMVSGVTFSSGNKAATCNLATGGLASISVGVTATAVAYPNGWWRVSITATTDDAGSINFIVRPENGSSPNYQGDGTGTIHVWGAQLEVGSFPTSYIPTTGTTVTRAADIATITGTNFSSWYRQDEQTCYVEAVSPPLGQFGVVGADNGTTSERWRIYGNAGNNTSGALVVDGNVIQLNATFAGGWPATTFSKQALGLQLNNAALASDGVIALTDTAVTMPTTTNLTIGEATSIAKLNNTISRLTYWPRRLPNPTLQSLTR